MVRKTEEERIAELELKIEQAKAQKQKLQARMREKERKERTRRLIQIGANFEKYLGIETVEQALQLIATYKDSIDKNKAKIHSVGMEEVRKKLGITQKEQQKNNQTDNKKEDTKQQHIKDGGNQNRQGAKEN